MLTNSRAYFSEFLGTFALVFCGTGAIVMNEASSGQVGHLGIALTFGLIVMAMIYSLGDVSGAHINPAVTIAFVVVNELSWKKSLLYIIFQLAGACLASITLRYLFPEVMTLGETTPLGSPWQSFALEGILTFILMFAIVRVSNGPKVNQPLAGLIIGGIVAMEAAFAGPVCGASMNPARSFGPAVVNGNLQHLWIYMLAPVSGALVAIIIARLFHLNFESKDRKK